MARRLASLLLAASVVFTGLTICPGGALSCTMLQTAKHTCCDQRLALREHNCCGRTETPRAAVSAIAAHPQRDESTRSVAVTLWLPDLHSAVRRRGACPMSIGGDPVSADTPITQHIQ